MCTLHYGAGSSSTSAESSGETSSCHKGVICDNCSKRDFKEKRYKCLQCFRYDLCESCFSAKASNKDHSTSHPMVALLTKKDYVAKLDSILKKVKNPSCAGCSDVYFDIPEVFAEQKLTGLGLVVSLRRAHRSEEIAESGDFISQETAPLKLTQDFKKLFLEEIGCDITFAVRGKNIKAHKVILTARSPIFSDMFQHDTPEAKSSTYTITDFEPEPFKTFLGFLYYAEIDSSLLSTQVTALYGLAGTYLVDGLKKICLEFMKGNIDDGNFCDIRELALTKGDEDLLDRTKEYFMSHGKNIIATQKWIAFNRKNPDDASELIQAAWNDNC